MDKTLTSLSGVEFSLKFEHDVNESTIMLQIRDTNKVETRYHIPKYTFTDNACVEKYLIENVESEGLKITVVVPGGLNNG